MYVGVKQRSDTIISEGRQEKKSSQRPTPRQTTEGPQQLLSFVRFFALANCERTNSGTQKGRRGERKLGRRSAIYEWGNRMRQPDSQLDC